LPLLHTFKDITDEMRAAKKPRKKVTPKEDEEKKR